MVVSVSVVEALVTVDVVAEPDDVVAPEVRADDEDELPVPT
jgi:hypothetical protein